jgi:hypothetical protein
MKLNSTVKYMAGSRVTYIQNHIRQRGPSTTMGDGGVEEVEWEGSPIT